LLPAWEERGNKNLSIDNTIKIKIEGGKDKLTIFEGLQKL